LWAASLREIKKRIRPLFRQERVATNAGLFLEGLSRMSNARPVGCAREAAGDPGPMAAAGDPGSHGWDADALRDIVRDYVIEHLADDDAVLVIDETGFLKQGKASCGVARNTLVPRARSRTARSESSLPTFRATVMRSSIVRCIFRRNGPTIQIAWKPYTCPPMPALRPKPKLATRMIARAIAASVPFKWVAGDTVYGVGDIEQQLRQAGKGYVLGVSSAHVFQSWGKRRSVAGKAADIARTRRSSDWKTPVGRGRNQRTRLHDGVISNWPISRSNNSTAQIKLCGRAGLLIRRHIADGDLAFFTTWCPAGTSIETLVAVEGHRWAIEDSFETAKNEFGARSATRADPWHGCIATVSLVMSPSP